MILANKVALGPLRGPMQEPHKDQLLIQRPDHMVLARVKNQQRVRAALLLLAIATREHALPFQDYDIKRGIRVVVSPDALAGLQSEAKDSTGLVYKERLSVGIFVVELLVFQQRYSFHFCLLILVSVSIISNPDLQDF
jgi:hypothetical protein